MLKLNVNGTVYENADSCVLYNLSAQELHAFDVYVMTGNIEAQEWLLARNANGSAKIKIEMDRFSNGEVVWAGQQFEIASGVAGESFSNPIQYTRKPRVDHYVYKEEFVDYTYWKDGIPHYYLSTGEMYNWWYGSYWYAGGNQRQYFRFYDYIYNSMTTNNILSARITTNAVNPRLQLEYNRTSYYDCGPFVSGQEIVFPTPAENPGLASFPITGFQVDSDGYFFSITKIEFKEKSIDTTYMLDDEAHIQMLPSHNAIAQEPVMMLGGTNNSDVHEIWGRTRASVPNAVIQAPGYYEDRSEWYINMATKDDSLRVDIVPSATTNLAELDLYMQDIIIIVEPSQHSRLRKNYMYYDLDNEPPRIERTGVTY